MPARPQIFIPNGHYHIYNRGHNKNPIFLQTKDYQRYLKRLEEYLKKHEVTLLCYCLMPNHVHLLMRQNGDEPIERFIHRLHTAYTMYFNIKYERIGAVFQGRFKAKLIETDEYLIHVSRYIHLNPLEILHVQGPALKLDKYPWSSLKEYQNSAYKICDTYIVLGYFEGSKQSLPEQKYQKFVENMINRVDNITLESISAGNAIFPEVSSLKARP